MNSEVCSSIVAALSGAIILTRDEFIQKGVPSKKAYLFTEGLLLDAIVKFTDILKEADHTK